MTRFYRSAALIVTLCATLCLAACQGVPVGPLTVKPTTPADTTSARLPTIAPPVEMPTRAATPTPAGPLALPSPRPTRNLANAQSEWASFGNYDNVHLLVRHMDGSLWAGTGGGVVRWSLADGSSQVFGSPNGLAGQHVTALLATSDGAFWAGTDAGLSRYDGTGWVTYTDETGLASNQVDLVFETSDGTLWCGTPSGLASYHEGTWVARWAPDEETSAAFSAGLETRDGALWFAPGAPGLLRAESSGNTVERTDAGPASPVRMVEGADLALWVVDDGGDLWRYDGAWTTYPAVIDGPIVALGTGAEGEVWVAGQAAVARLAGEVWTTYTTGDGLPEGPYRDLVVGYDGYVWCASAQGLARFDGEIWNTIEMPQAYSADIRTLLADQTQGLFLGTAEGIALLAGNDWSELRHPDPPMGAISALAEAPDGSIWFAQGEAGALRYASGRWTAIDGPASDAGTKPPVDQVYVPGDATVWASGPGYLAQYDPRSSEVVYESSCLADAHRRPLGQSADGTVWLASPSFLTMVDSAGVWTDLTATESLPPDTATVLLDTSDGMLWLGTEGGLYRSQTAAPAPVWMPVPGLRAQAVRDIGGGPAGTLWVAFPTGLGHYDGRQWEVLTSNDGLAGNDIRALALSDDDQLWVGTATGLSRRVDEGWQNDTVNDGLPAGAITAIVQAEDGGLWVGTARGLARLGLDGWTTVSTAGVTSASAGGDGSLWIGTSTGVQRYDALSGYELEDGDLETSPVSALLTDRAGRVWVDTPDGLARLVDGDWITAAQCGPGAGRVVQMAQDTQGSLWVLTDLGLYRHAQGRWQRLAVAGEMAPGTPVSMLVDPHDRVWYVSDRALAVHEQGTWSPVDLLGLPETVQLRGIATTDSETRWLATDLGLYQSHGGPWTLAAPSLTAVDVRYLVSSEQGDLWAASEGAIAHRSGGGWDEYLRDVDLPDAAVTTLLLASDGTLWAGTAGAGLLHFNDSGWSRFTSLHGLAHNTVEHLIETTEGVLWVVTPYGVSRFAPAP